MSVKPGQFPGLSYLVQSVLFLPCMLCYMHLILMASTLQHYRRPCLAFKGVRCVVALCMAGSPAQSSCAMAIS